MLRGILHHPKSHRLGRTVAAALFVVLAAGTGGAQTAPSPAAPPTLSGFWTASPLTTRWVIGQWDEECGPKPAGGGEAGGTVTVTQTGSELTFSGAGRTYATTQCWEQYPSLQRVGHSASARAWKTTCKTPSGDARQETVSTSLTATDTTISFYEAGQFQFQVQGKYCNGSVGRYRTYTLVKRSDSESAGAGSAKAAPSASAASDRCANPGPATKVDVRPSKKLLKAGEEFSFRAIVLDVHGCPVPAKAAWEITSGQERVDVSNGGAVRLKPDATEGEVRLTASASGHSAEVTIEVVSTERYNAVLSGGAFNAGGSADGGAAVAPAEATGTIGAASAVAEDKASGRKVLFVALIAGIALLLAGVGAFLFRRARATARAQTARYEAQKAEYEALVNSARAAPMGAPPAPQPPSPVASAPQPYAGNPVPPVAIPVAPPAAPPAAAPVKVCPICGTQYGPQFSFCGQDGGTLIPLS